MIVARYIWAEGTVSPLAAFLGKFDVVKAMGDVIAAEVVRIGETIDVDVNLEDVVIAKAGTSPEGDVYRGAWSPDPIGRGVALVGGPYDGDIVRVPRCEGSPAMWPMSTLIVMHDGPSQFWDGEPVPREVADADPVVAQYERAGIDPVARRFVYRSVEMKG